MQDALDGSGQRLKDRKLHILANALKIGTEPVSPRYRADSRSPLGICKGTRPP